GGTGRHAETGRRGGGRRRGGELGRRRGVRREGRRTGGVRCERPVRRGESGPRSAPGSRAGQGIPRRRGPGERALEAFRGLSLPGVRRPALAGRTVGGLLRCVLVVHVVHVSTRVQELVGSALDVGWTTSTRSPSAGAASASGSASGARRRAGAPRAVA